jgi:hypothetical protein
MDISKIYKAYIFDFKTKDQTAFNSWVVILAKTKKEAVNKLFKYIEDAGHVLIYFKLQTENDVIE